MVGCIWYRSIRSLPLTSYKFHRFFPLSQYDLPNHNSRIFSFHRPVPSPGPTLDNSSTRAPQTPGSEITSTPPPPPFTQEHISQNNPDVDYTRWVLLCLFLPYLTMLMIPGPTQTRSHLSCLLRRRKPDPRRRQSISCRNVCRIT